MYEYKCNCELHLFKDAYLTVSSFEGQIIIISLPYASTPQMTDLLTTSKGKDDLLRKPISTACNKMCAAVLFLQSWLNSRYHT